MSDEATTQESAGRRLARFSITPEIFVSMGSGVFKVIGNALPEDVTVVGAFYDEGRHLFAVIVESEEFAPVGDREAIPEMPAPVIGRVRR